jgi:hypothetical protein
MREVRVSEELGEVRGMLEALFVVVVVVVVVFLRKNRART